MNARLKNCPECGRLFTYMGRNLCPKCLEKEEEEYMVVRRYVRDHPGASIFEVSEETGIDEDKILSFLKDGRLESSGFTNMLSCERCGASINGGRFCSKCLAEMDNALRGVVGKNEKKTRPDDRLRERMYTKDK